MRPIKTLKQHTVTNTLFLIMSKSIALSLLAQGNTGTEILSILNSIVDDNVSESDDNGPTLNAIEF